MIRLLHLTRRDGQTERQALIERMGDLPPDLLRDYFPKGTDLSVHSPQHLLAVENELNRRPRQVIQDCTPTELFESLLTSNHVNCCNDD